MIIFKHTTKGKFILKTGTTVTIRKNLKGEEYYGGIYFNKKMEKYCKKTAKIIRINPDGCCVLDIDKEWVWSKEMLERPPYQIIK
jgi:hypothetical protein